LIGKRKAYLLGLCLLVVVLGFIFTGCAPSGEDETGTGDEIADEKPIELIVACGVPEQSEFHKRLTQYMVQKIEEETQGKIKCTVYPGGSLITHTEVYPGIVAGSADIGWIGLAALHTDRFPLLSLWEIPGHPFLSSIAGSYAIQEYIELIQPEELSEVKILFCVAAAPGLIYSKKPIRTLEDLRGLEIRCSGPMIDSMTALGTSPSVVPMQEVYEALDKGIVEATVSPLEHLKTWGFAEVAEYITVTPFMQNTFLYFMMNLETWNSLSPELQEAVERGASMAWEESAAKYYDEEGSKALEEAVKNGQIKEVIFLSEEEEARWKEKIAFAINDYAAELDAQGLPGTESKELMFELAEKYNNQYGPLWKDWDFVNK